MGTSQLGAATIETATHAMPEEQRHGLRPVDDYELLLRELLAEAHARIRVLEAALDRVKQAL